jgi:hypothetical protein
MPKDFVGLIEAKSFELCYSCSCFVIAIPAPQGLCGVAHPF